MTLSAAKAVLAVLQAILGFAAGALFWTAVQLATPDIGHWFVNALVLGPVLAVGVAFGIHFKIRRIATFGWAFAAGAVVYGYWFSLVVLAQI